MKKYSFINIATILIPLLLSASLLISCSSPQDRAAAAEAEYTEEKTKTLKEYKECVDNADGDDQKLEKCELLLKAVSAAEGSEEQ